MSSWYALKRTDFPGATAMNPVTRKPYTQLTEILDMCRALFPCCLRADIPFDLSQANSWKESDYVPIWVVYIGRLLLPRVLPLQAGLLYEQQQYVMPHCKNSRAQSALWRHCIQHCMQS